MDLLATDVVVRAFRADDPDHPIGFARGGTAHAEPAIPGWSMPVDELFLDDGH